MEKCIEDEKVNCPKAAVNHQLIIMNPLSLGICNPTKWTPPFTLRVVKLGSTEAEQLELHKQMKRFSKSAQK